MSWRRLAAGLAVASMVLGPAGAQPALAKSGKGAPAKDDPGCRACVSQASSLFARGQMSAAADVLRPFSARCPSYAQLHLLLSTILIRLGNAREEATQEAERAVRAAPSSTAARFQLGLTLMADGNSAAARGEFERVIELDPGNYEAWSTLANIYSQLHEDDLAQKASAKAADLEPGTRTVRLRTLKNLQRSGKTAEAVAELRKLIGNPESGPEFVQQLAAEAYAMGAWDEAIEAGQKVAEAYPRSLAPLKTVAQAQLAKHDFAGCLATAGKIVAIDSGNADGHALAGMAYTKQGDAEKAEKEFAAALKSQPDQALALAGMGLIYFGRDDFDQASEHLQRSLEGDPSLGRDPQVCFVLAQAFEKQGEPEFSLSYYKKSLAQGLNGEEAARARQAVERLQAGAAK